jgi:hypothetical protein
MYGAAGHARQVLQDYPPARGRILGRQGDGVQNTQASAVKYFARKVSHRIPEGMTREYQQINADVLRETFAGFDLGLVPPFFGRIIKSLRDGQLLELPQGLYEAAFATDLLDRMLFIQGMNDDQFVRRIHFALLSGAGYEVFN